MRHRARLVRFGIPALLLFYLVSPVLLGVDPWDAFPDRGDIAIIVLWTAALCLGGALLAGARTIGFALLAAAAGRPHLQLSFTSRLEGRNPGCSSRSQTPLRI